MSIVNNRCGPGSISRGQPLFSSSLLLLATKNTGLHTSFFFPGVTSTSVGSPSAPRAAVSISFGHHCLPPRAWNSAWHTMGTQVIFVDSTNVKHPNFELNCFLFSTQYDQRTCQMPPAELQVTQTTLSPFLLSRVRQKIRN